jgi:hypothetical protein
MELSAAPFRIPTLARTMYEPPAATADLAVLPGVLGFFSTGSPRRGRDKQDKLTLRRTEQVRLRSESRGTAGWLPGGTTISTISLRRLAHNTG